MQVAPTALHKVPATKLVPQLGTCEKFKPERLLPVRSPCATQEALSWRVIGFIVFTGAMTS